MTAAFTQVTFVNFGTVGAIDRRVSILILDQSDAFKWNQLKPVHRFKPITKPEIQRRNVLEHFWLNLLRQLKVSFGWQIREPSLFFALHAFDRSRPYRLTQMHAVFPWQCPSQTSRTFLMAVFLAASWVGVATAQDKNQNFNAVTRSDLTAFGEIFGEQTFIESGIVICRNASMLSPSDRYEYLLSWVIPTIRHPGFRVTADFSAAGAPNWVRASDRDGAEYSEHPMIVSPAVDLIRLAGQLESSDALRRRITNCPATSPRMKRNQLTLLALIAMQQGDAARAEQHLEHLVEAVRTDESISDEIGYETLLLADEAARSNPSSLAVRELVLFVILARQKDYVRPAWIRHLVAARAKMDGSTAEGSSGHEVSPQWYIASRERAFEHGNAFPLPSPIIGTGHYRNLWNYGDEYLFYQSPLRGSFTIDALATGFGYQEAELMVGGYWAGLVFDHEQCLTGNIREELSRHNIGRPLTDTGSYGYLRTRVHVRDGTATTSISGRTIHQQPIADSADPWVAIRTNYRIQGGVDNLRISGNPVIPDSLEMIDSEELLGWYDYFQAPGKTDHPLANWSAEIGTEIGSSVIREISDPQVTRLPNGSHDEHLLRYMRPMVENGTIEYEFWYEPGKTMAHPALGRNCFLIREDGVGLHRLTDGRFDRSELRPGNERSIDAQSGSPPPLQSNAWNQLSLSRRGDQIRLHLNGVLICESKIEPSTVPPSFGLFHFADQTSLRVRNPRWEGDWPKELPSRDAQQLAAKTESFLKWTSTNPGEEMRHRFDGSSMMTGSFAQPHGDPTRTVNATDRGLVVRQSSDAGFRGAYVAPTIEVGGDFDVIVSYDQFQCDSLLERVGSVRVRVIADSIGSDEAMIQRVEDRRNAQLIQCMKMFTTEGNQRRRYFGQVPCDGDSGRMKLSRRGDTIHYSAADGESDYFYYLGKESFVVDDLVRLGIQFGVDIEGPAGKVSGRFTEMYVRAEHLGGNTGIDEIATIQSLNQNVAQLPDSFSHDFTESPQTRTAFSHWGNSIKSDEGLKVTSPGTDDWTSAGLAFQNAIAGDFDISLEFATVKFPKPAKDQNTQVLLEVELSDKDRTQISATLTKTDENTVAAQALARMKYDGRFLYQVIGNQAIDDVNVLRVVRRGSQVFCVAGHGPGQSESIIGTMVTSQLPIDPNNVRVMLHTGGVGRTSQMIVQSIRVKAANIASVRPYGIIQSSTPVSQPEIPNEP